MKSEIKDAISFFLDKFLATRKLSRSLDSNTGNSTQTLIVLFLDLEAAIFSALFE
jgi:hypothetical protein